jgi:hypothetical protein
MSGSSILVVANALRLPAERPRKPSPSPQPPAQLEPVPA